MMLMTETRQGAAPSAPANSLAMSDPLPPNDPPQPVPPVPVPPPGPDLPEVPIDDPPGPEAPLPGDPTLPPAGDPPSEAPVRMKEIGGPSGPEPTRYGDWERKGRVSDF
jgi:hypothetical protein